MASLTKWVFLFFIGFYFYGIPCCESFKNEERMEVRKQSVSKIINDFGFLLFPTLASRGRESQENAIYSPLSITLALSMVYLGSSNTTALEIQNTLFGNQSKSGTEFHKQWTSLFETIGINNKQNGNQINLANGLWFNQKFDELQIQYRHELKEYYDAVIRAVDFSKQNSITEINDWVSLETKGTIESVVNEDTVNEETILILVNALYFKGLWQETFLIEDTYNAQFFINSTVAVNVKMMKKKLDCDLYRDDVLGFQMLKLPYVNGIFAMFIALPQELDSLSQIQNHLSSKQIDLWEKSLYETKVNVHLPRFTLTATYKLEQFMKELGIVELFDIQRANLSGISQSSQLHVSSFFHKAFIEVGEKGTEASAASGVHITKRSLDPEFIVDHPFIFWIKHIKTETVIFLGQVVVPNSENEKTYDRDITKRHIEL